MDQFCYLKITKLVHYFWNSIDANKLLNFLKGWQIA